MQTFLPYPSFSKSAACLDRQRLGKQRIEVAQILKTLKQGAMCEYDTATGKYVYGYVKLGTQANGVEIRRTPWWGHPIVQAWRGFEGSLVLYGLMTCWEWKQRGYKDTTGAVIKAFQTSSVNPINPPWLGDERVHASHRSNLLRKNAAHYGQFGWVESPDLPYFWPT